jgi:pimeloyl-ACP methyl ester carboxylesterase
VFSGRNRLTRIVKRLFVGVVAVFLIVVLAGNAYRIYGRYMLDRDFRPPGKMVDVGGIRMHIHCAGEGSPTILLEAGSMGFSTSWAVGGVFDRLQSITRVCAYDRSGLGWSESSPSEVTIASRLAELEGMLEASGESGPYIFVGASLGGALAWLYAQKHIDDAVGVITLDGVLHDRSGRSYENLGEDPLARLEGVFRAVAALGLQPLVLRAMTAPGVDESQIPESALPLVNRAHFLSEGFMDEMFMDVEASAETFKEMGSLGDLPLIVITHTRLDDLLQFMWGDRADEMEVLWQDVQEDMSKLSSNGDLWKADSGHLVSQDDPDIVLDAICEMVQTYRDSQIEECP